MISSALCSCARPSASLPPTRIPTEAAYIEETELYKSRSSALWKQDARVARATSRNVAGGPVTFRPFRPVIPVFLAVIALLGKQGLRVRGRDIWGPKRLDSKE